MTTARNGISKQLRRTLQVLVAAFVLSYLVAPQIAGARRAISLLARVNLWAVAVGVVLEVAALVAYAQISRAVLPRGQAPGVGTVLRMQLATRAVTNLVPGGSAAGGALGYKLLKQTGVRSVDAGFAVAMQGIGSAVVLNVLLWLGLVISIPLRGLHPLFGTAAMVGVVLFAGFAIVVGLLTHGEDQSVRWLCAVARRIPFLDERAVESHVRRLAERLRELGSDPALLFRGVGWSASYWLLDAAALWVFLAAFGRIARPDVLIVAYGLAYVLAAIPITPGGLGVVEAVLTTMLVAFGAPRDEALFGVIAYRLVNFWLPIPLGGLSYLSLQIVPREERERRAERLRRLAEEAVAGAEDPRHWAERHGVRVPHREGEAPPVVPPEDDEAASG